LISKSTHELYYELGRLPMIYTALQRLVNDRTAMWQPGLLATYTDLGLLDEAKTLFDELSKDDFRKVIEDELPQTCLVYLTETSMALSDSKKATGLYQRLSPYSGQMVSHPTAVCYGRADLYLGMLSSLINNLGEAEKFLACAASLSEKAGRNTWHAHIKYRHAQILQRHNYSGGKPVCNKLVDEPRTSALSLGMIKIQNKIEQLESDSSTDPTARLNGLAPRELGVLNLIAQGKSNKVIVAELSRSLATVATHVCAILNKTHTANRTEAAAFVRVNELWSIDRD
jgi:DNA-binding CsgD family transcriptional regulator